MFLTSKTSYKDNKTVLIKIGKSFFGCLETRKTMDNHPVNGMNYLALVPCVKVKTPDKAQSIGLTTLEHESSDKENQSIIVTFNNEFYICKEGGYDEASGFSENKFFIIEVVNQIADKDLKNKILRSIELNL